MSNNQSWEKPAAISIHEESNLEQGRYGPIYPITPANYGFTIIAKINQTPKPIFINMPTIWEN